MTCVFLLLFFVFVTGQIFRPKFIFSWGILETHFNNFHPFLRFFERYFRTLIKVKRKVCFGIPSDKLAYLSCTCGWFYIVRAQCTASFWLLTSDTVFSLCIILTSLRSTRFTDLDMFVSGISSDDVTVYIMTSQSIPSRQSWRHIVYHHDRHLFCLQFYLDLDLWQSSAVTLDLWQSSALTTCCWENPHSAHALITEHQSPTVLFFINSTIVAFIDGQWFLSFNFIFVIE